MTLNRSRVKNWFKISTKLRLSPKTEGLIVEQTASGEVSLQPSIYSAATPSFPCLDNGA